MSSNILSTHSPDLDYASPKTYFALSIFIFCWLMFARPWPQLPVGRTAAALLGGCLMVSSGIITPQEAFKSISGGTMLLLIGLMMILAKLEEKGVTHPLKKLLMWGQPTPRVLLARISICSALLGSLIMNDGAAIFLTSVVLEIVEEHDLLLEPFALAVATSANVGSAATVLGNPKNMLVQEKVPGLDFITFSKKMAPPAIFATLLNTLFLVLYYRNDLDDLPLVKNKVTKFSNPPSEFEEEDDDVLAMQQEYLASKQAQDEPNDLPFLGYLPAVAQETTPLKPNAPVYCPRITDTPKGYFTESISSRLERDYTEAPQWNTTALASPTRSIMSPAQSFSDADAREVGAVPRYPWPTQANIASPVSFAANSLNLSPVPLDNLSEYPFSQPGPPRSHLASFDQLPELVPREKTWKSYVKPLLIGTTLFGMYLGFILKWDLGWTCLTAAVLILFVDRQDASRIISDHVNWSLLTYLFGVFALLAGVAKTPLPHDVWQWFAPLINPKSPNLVLTTTSFAGLIVLLSFVFTSIPTVLLVSPYIPSLSDPKFSESAWYLLAWSVTLCGNLTAFGSVAGLIVSEICKDYCLESEDAELANSKRVSFGPRSRRKRANRWVGEFSVWTSFTSWSTIILLLLGSFYIVMF